MLSPGQTIIVADPNNFYRGRAGVVKSVATWPNVGDMAYVEIRSTTDNATIGFNIRVELCEPTLPAAPAPERLRPGRHLINEAGTP